MIYLDVLIIIFLFAAFGYSHTFLASLKIKRLIAEKVGTKIAFYRLFYNISSFMIFLAFYSLSPKPNVIIYDLQFPYDIITFGLQVLSLIGLVWASQGINLQEFLGISQIVRYYNGSYSAEKLDEESNLRISGALKIVRHPIYLFSILFIGLRPQMDLFYFIMFLLATLYFYVGSIYEEKKLIELFGNEYVKYQQNVPRLFPNIFRVFTKN